MNQWDISGCVREHPADQRCAVPGSVGEAGGGAVVPSLGQIYLTQYTII